MPTGNRVEGQVARHTAHFLSAGRTQRSAENFIRKRFLPALLISALMMLTACRTVHDLAYAGNSEPVQVGANSRLFMIDVRQDGKLSCSGKNDAPEECTSRLERMNKWLADESPDPPVIVFIHGWHHNGNPNDKNLTKFKEFIAKLESDRREAGAIHPEVNAIYVAWRGDEVQFIGPSWMQTLDFYTVWSRKNASIAVGSDGLKKIVDSLKQNAGRRAVIVIGHSFGASALYYAVKDDLGEPALNGFEFIMMNPAVAEREFDVLRRSMAERNRVAVGASDESVQSIIRRNRRRLMVLQALGDSAVNWAYRIAFVGTPVGFSKSKHTHLATVCFSECPEAPTDPANSFYQRLPSDKTPAMIITADPKEDWQSLMGQEIWVVTGKDAVSKSHNDIFTDVQGEALAAQVEVDIRAAEQRLLLSSSTEP